MDEYSNLWAVKNPTKWDFEFDSNNSDPASKPIVVKAGMTRLMPKGIAKWVANKIVDEIIKREYKFELTIDQSFRATILPQVLLGESSGYLEDIQADAPILEKKELTKEELASFDFSKMTYKQLQKLAGEKKINPLQKREVLIEALSNA